MKNKGLGKMLKTAFLATTPVMAGYLVLGMGFGIIMKTRGYGIIWSLAMSAFIYAGSMQYVAIDLLTGGASLITTAITTLMVNARHLFYGISMVDRYKGAGAKKPYIIFALTDETYALVSGELPVGIENRHAYYFMVSLMDQIYWVTGSLIGAALGSLITFSVEGIDFALTALFVTVFVEQWLSTKDHVAAIVGVFASVVCLVIFGPDRFLIPAMISIAVLLTVVRRVRKERADG